MYTRPKTDELTLDSDHDGLSNGKESAMGSDPYQFAPDGDGISDTNEGKQQSHPLIETEPITEPTVAKERYYHHASQLLGWDQYSGLSWDTLYHDVRGNFELGWVLDKSVYERAISQGESPTNAVYLLAQSPFLQYHKQAGLIGVKEMADYTQQLLQENQKSSEKTSQNPQDFDDPDLEK